MCNKNMSSTEITVHTLMKVQQITFQADVNHTILDLKRFLAKEFTPTSHHEVVLTISTPNNEYPYPLRDDLKLSVLLPEHRELFLLITENPAKVTPSRLVKIESSKKMLDLRECYSDDVPYIGTWLVSYPAFLAFGSLWLNWDHANFADIIDTVRTSLEGTLDVEERPGYPKRIYIECPTGLAPSVAGDRRWLSLRMFFHTLRRWESFHRIHFYVSVSADNVDNDFVPMTADMIKHYDLVLSGMMW